MGKINYYKLATTVLFHKDHEPKTFYTQEDVDKAWEEGWYGPKGLLQNLSLISEMKWETKQAMIDAVQGDPRYEGLTLSKVDTFKVLVEKTAAFEEENGIAEVE